MAFSHELPLLSRNQSISISPPLPSLLSFFSCVFISSRSTRFVHLDPFESFAFRSWLKERKSDGASVLTIGGTLANFHEFLQIFI